MKRAYAAAVTALVVCLSRYACAAFLAGLAACSRSEGKPDANAASSASAAETSPAARAIASENAKAEADVAASRSQLPRWVAVAEQAPVVGPEARKERQASQASVKHATLVSIDNLLESVANEPPTAAGLIEGARIIEEGKALGSDREWSGSGTTPGARLLHHGGLALLVAIGQRACAAKPGDKAIGVAADTAPLPALFGSGGVDRSAAERDRHLLQEATRACGSHP